MRHFILLMLLGITLASVGQDNPYSEFQKKFNMPLISKIAAPQLDAFKMPSIIVEGAQPMTVTGQKVAILSQDRMPCIVPDMTALNMPNAWHAGASVVPSIAAIPNPGLQPVARSSNEIFLKRLPEKLVRGID